MKIALFGTNQIQFAKVYTPEVLEKLGSYGELSPKINQQNLEENADFLEMVKLEKYQGFGFTLLDCYYFVVHFKFVGVGYL